MLTVEAFTATISCISNSYDIGYGSGRAIAGRVYTLDGHFAVD